jgi:hypothetical protein
MLKGKSWVSYVLLAVVVLAIWKMNNGDPAKIVDSIWAILNKGADMVTSLWNKFMSMSVPSTPIPTPTPTP